MNSAADADRLKRLATVASLSVGITLSILKLGAAWFTGSAALLASLVDSLADVGASVLTYFAVRVASQPPDRSHRFGHGKAESLSALAQACVIGGSSVFVLLGAIERLMAPVPVTSQSLGLAVMALSIAMTAGLVTFQRRVIRRTGSPAIDADSVHYQADLWTNLAVIVSLLAGWWFAITWPDPVSAILITGFLLYGSGRIGKRAIGTLMDHELPAAERDRIKVLVLAHPEVQDIHDLRTREAAGTRFIEFHVELPPQMTVVAAHEVTDALEHELATAYGDAEIIIHQEPAGLDDDRLDHRIQHRARAGG